MHFWGPRLPGTDQHACLWPMLGGGRSLRSNLRCENEGGYRVGHGDAKGGLAVVSGRGLYVMMRLNVIL